MTPLATIVLAGGRADAVAAQQRGAPNKAFVEIGGKPLVTRVLEALRSTPSIGRIAVVAPPGAHNLPALALADERRPDRVRITASLRSGLRGFPPDDDVLVVASDLPILTPQAVDDCVERTRRLDADVVHQSADHVETYARMGDRLGEATAV